MVGIGLQFGIHGKRAEGAAQDGATAEISQGWKGIHSSEEVIEVSERNTNDEEAGDSCECREENWEARMKWKVFQKFGSKILCERQRVPIFDIGNTFYRELFKDRELAMKDDGEEGERTCCGVQGASDECHFADIVA